MNLRRFLCFTYLIAAFATSLAAEDGLRAQFRTGQVLSYEFEGHFSFVPDRIALNPATDFEAGYRQPSICDYYFSSLIELRIQSQPAENAFAGIARYVNPKLTQWQCPGLDRKKTEDRLQALAETAMPFSINDRGEISVPPLTEQHLDFRGTFRLLTSATLDLLHTVLARGQVEPGVEWKPRENFVYWKEYVDTGLELSASTAKYVREVKVAGDNCVLLDFKYILAPQDLAASVATAQGSVRAEYAGTVSTGLLQISTLFDRTTGQIAWVRRSREIDNRLYLGNNQAGESATLTHFLIHEESTVRQLRQDAVLEWTSALSSFESSGGVPVRRAAQDDSNPLMRAAAEARLHRRAGVEEAQQLTPPGYTRYEKRLCSNTWSCSVVSIALPGSIESDDDSPMRVTFLVSKGRAVASIVIGPDQQKISRGLSDQEELRKSALAFLAGKMWLHAGPGTADIMSDTYIGEYPGLITHFTTARTDSVRMEGKLASILTSWGEIISVGCGYAQSDAAIAEQVCGQMMESIRVRQIEP